MSKARLRKEQSLFVQVKEGGLGQTPSPILACDYPELPHLLAFAGAFLPA